MQLYTVLALDTDFMWSGIPPNRHKNRSVLKRLSWLLFPREALAALYLLCSIQNSWSISHCVVGVSVGYTQLVARLFVPVSVLPVGDENDY